MSDKEKIVYALDHGLGFLAQASDTLLLHAQRFERAGDEEACADLMYKRNKLEDWIDDIQEMKEGI